MIVAVDDCSSLLYGRGDDNRRPFKSRFNDLDAPFFQGGMGNEFILAPKSARACLILGKLLDLWVSFHPQKWGLTSSCPWAPEFSVQKRGTVMMSYPCS